MGQKGVFWIMGDTHILVSYNIVYSDMITFIEGLKNGKIYMEKLGSIPWIVLLGLVKDDYMTNESN